MMLRLLLLFILIAQPLFAGTMVIKDGAGATQYISVEGSGTSADPFIPQKSISSPLGAFNSGLLVIDSAHNEIHLGNDYVFSGATSLDLGQKKNIILTTPDTAEYANLTFAVRGTVETNAVFYESPTTSGGSSANAYNRNRNSSNTPDVTVTEDVTVSATGTALEAIHFGTTNKTGGGESGRHEWILKQDTTYLLQITSESNSNDVSWILDWYEN